MDNDNFTIYGTEVFLLSHEERFEALSKGNNQTLETAINDNTTQTKRQPIRYHNMKITLIRMLLDLYEEIHPIMVSFERNVKLLRRKEFFLVAIRLFLPCNRKKTLMILQTRIKEKLE